MSTMVAMEGLWQYLRTLPRSNKQWLSERLQEDLHPKAATTDDDEKYISKEEVLAGIDLHPKAATTDDDEKYISKEEVLAGIDAGLKDLKAGRMRPARDVLNELRNGI